MSLHRAAGTIADLPPTTAAVDRGRALAVVASADASTVPTSSKLDVLGSLARAGLPGYTEHEAEYRDLAEAIGNPHGITADQVIADVKAAASGTAFSTTESGRTLPHHVTAFFMEDLCNTASVVVDGRGATWVFSEFETDAPYEDVAAWVDPRNWPERSPLMFKGMAPLDGIHAIESGAGVEQWHGRFLETVQLVDRLETELHCDYYRHGDLFTGMTYSFLSSRADQLDVDRGFLLVNDLGDSRHVKALKIVGFTNAVWNDVARWVCPIWTDFVRGAVRGGSSSGGLPASSTPGTVDGVVQQWASMARTSVAAYTTMATEWAQEVGRGGYGPDRLVRDGARFWLQVYRDWANASATMYAALENLAQEPPNATAPPVPLTPVPVGVAGPAHRSAAVARVAKAKLKPVPVDDQEGTTIPVLGLEPGGSVRSSHLNRIGAKGAVIPAEAISAQPTPLTETVTGVRIEADVTNIPEGLYVGEVLIGDGGRASPVQLYVSRAVSETAT